MHEYAIVQALIERAGVEARARGASRVHRLQVSLGSLSNVDPALLATAYETFRERTICASADLELRRLPAIWSCEKCDRPIVAGGPLQCRVCGAPARLVQGDELVLDRIELEVA